MTNNYWLKHYKAPHLGGWGVKKSSYKKPSECIKVIKISLS